MNLKIDKTGKQGVLNLSGSLTIDRIKEVKEQIQEALKEVDNLVIDHSGATEFDLTYFQLLYSCYKTTQKMQKKLSTGNSAGFSEMAEALGFPGPEFNSYQDNERG